MDAMTKKSGTSELVSNRRARHDYEILESYEAGIILTGTEVKSLRSGGGSLQEAYITVKEGELWLINASIAPYRFGNIANHAERRPRKLLMHKREISRLKAIVQEKGLALIPLSLYLKEGRVKISIGQGRGKKMHDKRAAIKERDEKRQIDRIIRGN